MIKGILFIDTLIRKLTRGTFESLMSHSWWGCCCWLPATFADIVGEPTRLLKQNIKHQFKKDIFNEVIKVVCTIQMIPTAHWQIDHLSAKATNNFAHFYNYPRIVKSDLLHCAIVSHSNRDKIPIYCSGQTERALHYTYGWSWVASARYTVDVLEFSLSSKYF